MKISQIIQETSTTAGSVAPTEMGFVKMQTRNPSVYGGNKVGNLLKGKKTNKAFANSLNEAAMKDLAYDLQNMKPAEFQKKYGKTREEMKASMNKQPQQRPAPPVNETDLSEQDLIVVPGQGRSVKTGFVPHGKSRIDHEVEMARSDLFSAAKNAKKVYEMIQDVSEEEGLDGWVQEKIIKANDYLNTIREYLEGKQVQGMNEGLHPMVIDDVKKLATLNPVDRYSAYGNIRGYFKGDPTLSKMASDIMGGYYEADMLRGKYKTAEAKAKYAELEPMHQSFIKQALGQEQGMNEGKQVQGTSESLGTTGAMTNGEMGEGQLDELSPKALGSYVKSASGDMANRKGNTQFQKGARVATSAFTSKQSPSRFEKDSKIEKRQAGIDRAVDKITGKK
jgi:hypothetical protein